MRPLVFTEGEAEFLSKYSGHSRGEDLGGSCLQLVGWRKYIYLRFKMEHLTLKKSYLKNASMDSYDWLAL